MYTNPQIEWVKRGETLPTLKTYDELVSYMRKHLIHQHDLWRFHIETTNTSMWPLGKPDVIRIQSQDDIDYFDMHPTRRFIDVQYYARKR